MADYTASIVHAAKQYGIDPNILLRQLTQESGLNPNARSGAGAIGIAQFMPGTAKSMGVNPYDPQSSISGAARLDAQLLNRYHGSYADALAAYNAGPGKVDQYGGVPPFAETQNYVKTILGHGGAPPTASVPSQAPASPSNGLPPVLAYALTHDPRSLLQAAGAAEAAPTNAGTGMYPGAGQSSPSNLLELFWQGQGGIDVKNGQREPQGFVSGHQDHVHVAAAHDRLPALEKLARQYGLQITSTTGGTHVPGSYHYQGMAFDAAGNPLDESRFAHAIARLFGIR